MTSPIPFEQYDSIGSKLRSEVDELNLALASGRVIIREQRDTVDLQSFQLADRARVIARLLDGWRMDDAIGAPQQWLRINEYPVTCETAEMSNGEAAIIRAHQEKT